MNTKLICNSCDWQGTDDQLLTAQNPFNTIESICGCPACKAIDDFTTACDEPGCWNPHEMGTPMPDGFRMTCRKHYPNP